MSIEVACIACSQSFDAVVFAGLVRCGDCEERLAPRFPSAASTVTTVDSPADAWA